MAAGLTQEELAARAGVSTRGISDLERGVIRAPQRHTLERLAVVLELSADERDALAAMARRTRVASAHTTPAAPIAPQWPIPPTALIGREHELAGAAALVQDPAARLLSILGPPGIGKTRLALAIAATVGDDFPQGVTFVALAAINDPAAIAPAIARALALREEDDQAPIDRLRAGLSDGRRLLILDNFEQILAAAPLVADLLAACPALTIVVTSRAPLRLRGERQYLLPPLATPDSIEPLPPEELAGYAAVALFVRRAEDVRADFTLNATNAQAIAAICARLDGLPLAIELAASWIKYLAPSTLLARLSDRLRILTDGARDLPPRQRTLRAAIDWSYALLDEGERILFRRLAVFVGGWTLAAAEAVCGEDGPILADLVSLLDKSLLQQDGDGDEPRFAMLETIREYATEQLRESGEAAAIEARHAAVCLALVEEALTHLYGPEDDTWLARLTREHDNLRAALRRAIDREDVETAQHLTAVLLPFWFARGYLSEGRAWCDEALTLGVSHWRPDILRRGGVLAARQGDYVRAIALAEEALAAFQARDDTASVAAVLSLLGATAVDQGDDARATRYHEEALAIFRAQGATRNIAILLNNLGLLATRRGDYDRAVALCEESLVLKHELGDRRGIAATRLNLGEVMLLRGNLERADELFAEVLARAQEFDDKHGIGVALLSLGQVALARDDLDLSARQCDEGLALLRVINDRPNICQALRYLGTIAIERGEYALAADYLGESVRLARTSFDRVGLIAGVEVLAAFASARGNSTLAARLYGATDAQREVNDMPLALVYRPRRERQLEDLRVGLGVEAFTTTWEGGRALSLSDALDAALDVLVPAQ